MLPMQHAFWNVLIKTTCMNTGIDMIETEATGGHFIDHNTYRQVL